MKIYLDDLRPCPNGWILAKNAGEAITLLATNLVEMISLDHDLGPPILTNGTGYEVIKYIEAMVYLDESYVPPEIIIHTGNPVGRKNMDLVLISIKRKLAERE